MVLAFPSVAVVLAKTVRAVRLPSQKARATIHVGGGEARPGRCPAQISGPGTTFVLAM
ncbi:hypothetical protein Q8A49_03935 [Nocardiopsis umidischolae]|uniref:Uncharacterized protein n=1 Tax=Nocardiopsis tropica TaxID=109330 RepID=A0ABU7KK27_9ACTN|nr:hypothetical protein [Nocardiopsis umidischolae]